MRTLHRLSTALRFPLRTRRRALLSLLVLACLGAGAWYGVQLYRFHRAYAAAEEALARYDFPAARSELATCIEIRPGDPDARLLAAQAARRDGALDEAQTHLSRYREEAGSTEEWRLESTLVRVMQSHAEADLAYVLPLAEEEGPARERILEALAAGSVAVYQHHRTAVAVGLLLKYYPKNPIGRLLRAEHALIRGTHDRAIETCREILADYPHFIKARLLLAGVLLQSQRYEEGEVVYRELHRERPGDLEVVLGLARCLTSQGRFDDARPLLEELERQYPDRAPALLECGRQALRDDRLTDALRLLERGVELAPHDPELRRQLAICLERLGRSEEASRHIAVSKQIDADLYRMELLLLDITKDPQNLAPRREMGRICLRNGDAQEGLRWLYGILDSHPNDRATHEILANYFRSQGNAERAGYHDGQSR